jgi:C1A family cysteine protease
MASVPAGAIFLWTTRGEFNNQTESVGLRTANKLMSYRIARYGWVPDLPDQRDHLYAAPVEVLGVLPARVDLRAKCPAIYDQGQLGSCTANAIAGAIEFDRVKQGLSDFVPSRLFIYYNERVIEHTVDFDSGAQIRDGIKSVAKQGDCPETEWPYVIARFRTKPTARCYADALKYRVVLYQRLTPLLNQLKGCLASGYPFVFGFTVYESFESAAVARTGHASQFVGWTVGFKGLFHAALRVYNR